MNAYLTFKALHLIAVISWMAGLLYLPRIFVYHTETIDNKGQSETFKLMEKRLYFYIMNPAMILSWIFGLLLIHAKVRVVLRKPSTAGGGQGSAPTSSAASSWPGSPCTCHMHSRRMQCTTAHTRRLSPRSGCGPACCCARRGSCAGTACAAPRARPPPPAATPRHRPSARLTAPRSAASAGCRAWATQGSPPPARRGPPGPGGWTARLPPLRIRRSTPLLPSPRCCRRISRLPSPGGAPAAAPRRRCGTGA